MQSTGFAFPSCSELILFKVLSQNRQNLKRKHLLSGEAKNMLPQAAARLCCLEILTREYDDEGAISSCSKLAKLGHHQLLPNSSILQRQEMASSAPSQQSQERASQCLRDKRWQHSVTFSFSRACSQYFPQNSTPLGSLAGSLQVHFSHSLQMAQHSSTQLAGRHHGTT